MPSPHSVRRAPKCRAPYRRSARRSSWRFDEFDLRRRRNPFLIDQLSSLVDELGYDAHRDFLMALRANLDSHRAGDARQLFGCGELLLGEMLENGAGLARAADHAEEQERPVNPLLEH